MGVITKTTTEYQCDKCWVIMPESEVYNGDMMTLRSDRDVSVTATVGIEINVPYSNQRSACCKNCAASLLRQFADRIVKGN